ncbi:MAG TPA: adenylate kinase [Bacteroidales bacterium]|nr:adenylate kinase [Bacteroidales bacterium]HPS73698.1 adenylate kinase [Bacteroidales bacterium]
MLNLVLFGPPGAGKGTQALKIAEKYRLLHISTGDILRAEIAKSSPLGLRVKSIIDRGELVSDDILVDILRGVIEDHREVKGFIFDGFPRTIPQAEALKVMLKGEGQQVTGVVSLKVNDEELIKRLLNRALETGRSDDNEEVIRKRLQVYNSSTKPLLDYYREEGILNEVVGIGPIDVIFQDICTVIDKF